MSEYYKDWNPEDDQEDIYEDDGDELDEEGEEDDEDDEDDEWDAEEDDIGAYPLTEDTEEEILYRTAVIEFGFKFSEYVKEVDPELWKRAIDYAVTFTKVEGVAFHSDTDATGNAENDGDKPSAT
jgi:hypothetical protein